jgi:hypothetical protein
VVAISSSRTSLDVCKTLHIFLECAAIMLCVLYSCSSGIAEATLTLASERTVHEYLKMHGNNQHVQVRTKEDITVLCSPSSIHYKMTDEQPEADFVVAVNGECSRACCLIGVPTSTSTTRVS